MSKLQPTVDLGYPTESRGNIPSFANIEEEAEFWDTHDSTDFLADVEPIRLPPNQRRVTRLVISLTDDERQAFDAYARRQGIDPSVLAHRWIFERLRQEVTALLPEVEHGAAD